MSVFKRIFAHKPDSMNETAFARFIGHPRAYWDWKKKDQGNIAYDIKDEILADVAEHLGTTRQELRYGD